MFRIGSDSTCTAEKNTMERQYFNNGEISGRFIPIVVRLDIGNDIGKEPKPHVWTHHCGHLGHDISQ